MSYGCISNSIYFIFTHNKIELRKNVNIVLQEQFHLACPYRLILHCYCHHCFVLLVLWGFANILSYIYICK